jgi:predicted small lipoprotein YifL
MNVKKILSLLLALLLVGSMAACGNKPAENQNNNNGEPQQNKEARNIIGEAEFGRADHRLKRPDGASARGRRAGVAVQSRHADGLSLSLIQAALEEVGQVDVCQQRRSRLYPAPKTGQKMGHARSLLIQCPHTPNII